MSSRRGSVPDVGAFDETELNRRVTIWTLLTEGSKSKVMISRMQRDRTLFAPATHAIRKLLHRDTRVIAAAQSVLDEVLTKGASFDVNLYTYVWKSWLRAFVDASESDAFTDELARGQFKTDGGGADVLGCERALAAIVYFVHMWCDEVHHDGYCNFLQALRSNTKAFTPFISTPPPRESLPPFPSCGQMPAHDLRVSPQARPTPGESPRLMSGTSGHEDSKSLSGTPQPLRRGLRVMWVPGSDEFVPKQLARPRPATLSLNSPSKLDTEAQLKLWSPDSSSRPAADEDVAEDEDLRELTPATRRSVFDDSCFSASDMDVSRSHRGSPWVMGETSGGPNSLSLAHVALPPASLLPNFSADSPQRSGTLWSGGAEEPPLAYTRPLPALHRRSRERKSSDASSRGNSARRRSGSQRRNDFYTLPSPASVRGLNDSLSRSGTNPTSEPSSC